MSITLPQVTAEFLVNIKTIPQSHWRETKNKHKLEESQDLEEENGTG